MAVKVALTLCVTLIALGCAAAGTFSASSPGSDLEARRVRRTVRGQPLVGPGFLRRSKRRWSPPPFKILENTPGPFPKEIDQIVSDSQQNFSVYYTISGPGVDEPPTRLFSLHRDSGMLSVHSAVDREVYPSFRLKVRVFDKFTQRETDEPLIITVDVDDMNDNAPKFKDALTFAVAERSAVGAIVGQVNATDRDLAGSLHTKIQFTLLSGQDLFAIHPTTGVITTKTNTLDRETKDKHVVTVQIKDMAGAQSGLFSQGQAYIDLIDINDNPPTFTKSSYQAGIPENAKDKLILRIPVEDKDLKNTPNWISKFVISQGNEDGNFRIDTDPKTNDGLLYVTKPLDYEKNRKVNLQIRAENQAKLSGTTAQWATVPVVVDVTDVDEGPEFPGRTVFFTVEENIPNGTVLGTYSAIDPETRSGDGIMYYKATDPAGWVSMERTTGELKVANTIDRESSFVKDGMYNISVRAVDSSSKTGTGTVVIVVKDVNDNVPTLPPGEMVLCEKEGELGSVLLVAEDRDLPPLSDPFTFSMPSDGDGTWTVSRFNNTAATLQHIKELPTGIHHVPVMITDLQGKGAAQTATVRICECRDGVCLDKDRSSVFGGLGVLAMLLPLLLLLLLALLLILFCTTKREKVPLDDTTDVVGSLITSNTEAPGDEVDSSLMIGMETTKSGVKSVWSGDKSASTIGGQSTNEHGLYKNGISTTTDVREYQSNQYQSNQYQSNQYQYNQYDDQQFEALGTGMTYDYRAVDSAFSTTWRTNDIYLQQKLGHLGTDDERRYADDYLKAYGYEGMGSTAGSVGCCSDFGGDESLDFLNSLGPKFTTLADACRKT